MAFSHDDVTWLFWTAMTYHQLAYHYAPKPEIVIGATVREGHDNCTSAPSKIYDYHCVLDGVSRELVIPQSTFIMHARNWGKFAVGYGTESGQWGNEWLQKQGWVMVSYQQRLCT